MPADIKSLQELAPHVEVGKVFKYNKDGGQTWQFTKIVRTEVERYEDGSRGYPANGERIGRSSQIHPLVDKDFARGMIVRVASARESAGKKWSYE